LRKKKLEWIKRDHETGQTHPHAQNLWSSLGFPGSMGGDWGRGYAKAATKKKKG